MIKISFIVPVYNTQQYLAECLDSIVSQISGNELILVDDGSTDGSGKICDSYADKYPEITVIHTKNHGASHARNLGAEEAKGEYICYIDSDDYINRDFSKNFHEGFDSDVIFYPMQKKYGFDRFIPMGDGLCREAISGKSSNEVLSYIAGCPKFPASPAGKLVRREFLLCNGIHFAFDKTGEDYDWTYSLLRFAKSYDFFDAGMYTYRQHFSGRSSMKNPTSVDDHLTIISHWANKAVEPSYRKYLVSFLAFEYAMLLPFFGVQDTVIRKSYLPKMKEYKHLLRFGKTRKLKLIQWSVRLLGVDTASRVLYRYVTNRNEGYAK